METDLPFSLLDIGVVFFFMFLQIWYIYIESHSRCIKQLRLIQSSENSTTKTAAELFLSECYEDKGMKIKI